MSKLRGKLSYNYDTSKRPVALFNRTTYNFPAAAQTFPFQIMPLDNPGKSTKQFNQRRHCLYVIAVGSLCIVGLVRSADGGEGTEFNREVTIKKLADISKIAKAHENHFENLLVKANLQPRNEAIVLSIHGSQCRLDRQINRANHDPVTSYWLDNGSAAFSFSSDMLVIDSPLGSRDQIDSGVARQFWIFQLPEWDGRIISVSKFCELLIEYVDQGKVFRNGSSIAIREKSDITEIELTFSFGKSPAVGRHVVIALDNSKSYVMVSWAETDGQGQKAGDYLFERRIKSNYQEIAPSLYFLKTGTWWQKTSGLLPRDAQEENESEVAIEVETVKFGDFEIDKSWYDIHSWPPIKKGIAVHDNRVKPPLKFTYDDGPFDDAVLNRALRDVKLRQQNQGLRGSWILITFNVLIFFLLAAFWVKRRMRLMRRA